MKSPLDEPIYNAVTSSVIDSRVVVDVVCAECGARIGRIRKAIRGSGGRVQLTTFQMPRNPATHVTISSILQGPTGLDQSAWCPKHGDRGIPMPAVYATIKQALDARRPKRMAV